MKKTTIITIALILCIPLIFIFGNMRQEASLQKMLSEGEERNEALEEKDASEAKSIYVSKKGDTIKIRSKYDEAHDAEVTWKRKGANEVFDYNSFALIENEKDYVGKRGSRDIKHSASTDFLGPHRVLAKNDIDGEFLERTDFTGGNHAYDGGNTGSHTARTENIKIIVDGKEQTDFSGYADEVSFEWENFVQASNTKKADGSGREVLKENYNVSFDGEVFNVENNIEFLEDVYWETYYGLQFSHRDMWTDTLEYADGSQETLDATEDSTSENKLTEKIVLGNGVDFVELYMDPSVGIGERNYLNNRNYGAHNIADTQKSYFWLVDGADISGGETVQFEGHYRFYSNK